MRKPHLYFTLTPQTLPDLLKGVAACLFPAKKRRLEMLERLSNAELWTTTHSSERNSIISDKSGIKIALLSNPCANPCSAIWGRSSADCPDSNHQGRAAAEDGGNTAYNYVLTCLLSIIRWNLTWRLSDLPTQLWNQNLFEKISQIFLGMCSPLMIKSQFSNRFSTTIPLVIILTYNFLTRFHLVGSWLWLGLWTLLIGVVEEFTLESDLCACSRSIPWCSRKWHVCNSIRYQQLWLETHCLVDLYNHPCNSTSPWSDLIRILILQVVIERNVL